MTDPVEHLARLAGLELTDAERSSLRPRLEVLQSLLDALPEAGQAASDPSRIPCPRRSDEPTGTLDADGHESIGIPESGSWIDMPPVLGDER